MFGKVQEGELEGIPSVSVAHASKGFQSPCAGNMFGKLSQELVSFVTKRYSREFQSPCAGNMFGKRPGYPVYIVSKDCCFNPRVRGTCLVRKKILQARSISLARPTGFNPRVRGTCLVRLYCPPTNTT